jgi:L-fucose isomerase-like protein
MSESTDAFKAKAARFAAYSDFSKVPKDKFATLVKISVALDEIIAEAGLDALALRCWLELEKILGVAPCVVLGELNDRKFPAACELDVGNAVAMRALSLATGESTACLDWNNNYGDDPDKCILFHCGPVAKSLMRAKGQVIDHPMFAKALGAGCGFGCDVGRIAPTSFSFASSLTKDGGLDFYLGEGEFTADPIPPEFFGCAGVARIEGLQAKLNRIGYAGYRHHVSVAPGHVAKGLREAFVRYLNYGIAEL